MFIGIVSVRLIDFSTGCHWYDFVLTDRWQLTGKWPFESSKGGRLGCIIGGKHMKPSWFLGWERGACLSAKSFVRNSAQNLSCLYTVGVLSFGDLLDSSSRHCIYKYLTFLNESPNYGNEGQFYRGVERISSCSTNIHIHQSICILSFGHFFNLLADCTFCCRYSLSLLKFSKQVSRRFSLLSIFIA